MTTRRLIGLVLALVLSTAASVALYVDSLRATHVLAYERPELARDLDTPVATARWKLPPVGVESAPQLRHDHAPGVLIDVLVQRCDGLRAKAASGAEG